MRFLTIIGSSKPSPELQTLSRLKFANDAQLNRPAAWASIV